MTASQQLKAKFLENMIKSCNRQVYFFNLVIIVVLATIPISMLTGNKITGFSAISFFVGNFVNFTLLSAKLAKESAENAAKNLELISELSEAVKKVSEKNNDGNDKFNPISMN